MTPDATNARDLAHYRDLCNLGLFVHARTGVAPRLMWRKSIPELMFGVPFGLAISVTLDSDGEQFAVDDAWLSAEAARWHIIRMIRSRQARQYIADRGDPDRQDATPRDNADEVDADPLGAAIRALRRLRADDWFTGATDAQAVKMLAALETIDRDGEAKRKQRTER